MGTDLSLALESGQRGQLSAKGLHGPHGRAGSDEQVSLFQGEAVARGALREDPQHLHGEHHLDTGEHGSRARAARVAQGGGALRAHADPLDRAKQGTQQERLLGDLTGLQDVHGAAV